MEGQAKGDYMSIPNTEKEREDDVKFAEILFPNILGAEVDPRDICIPAILNAVHNLPEKEQHLLRLRFRERKTIAWIANSMCVSSSTVRLRFDHILYKLRHPKISRNYLVSNLIRRINEAEADITDFKAVIHKMNAHIFQLEGQLQQTSPNEVRQVIRGAKVLKIEDMNLSAGAFNALKRSGYSTADSLCGLTIEQIAKIKNVGVKRSEEIYSKLATYFGYQP